MGLIRRTASVATLGLVSGKSSKKKLRDAQARQARAEASRARAEAKAIRKDR